MTDAPDAPSHAEGEEGTGPSPHDQGVDRVDFDPGFDPDDPVQCEVCGARMFYTAACKLRCPACGYTRDCSDP